MCSQPSYSRGALLWSYLIILTLQHSSAGAQQVTGDLQFRVVDSLAQPIAGVNAVVTGVNVQGVRGAISDDIGYVTILTLPPGKVSLRISHTAYQTVVFNDVLIQLGKTTGLGEIQLRQRAVEMSELVISSQRPSLDPNSTTYGSNLRASDFENLPVERNYRSMTSLLPQANASYFGDEVNIGGATGFENKYFVDGVEVTNPVLGTTAMTLPYNFVQEVELKGGGYEAEFRGSLGGLINVVTYSGTNDFSGTAFGFYSSNRFGRNRKVGLLDPPEAGFSDYDFGLSLSGPIIRDELWFSAAYNPTYAVRDVSIPSFGITNDKTLIHSLATKLTWTASSKVRLVLSTTGDPTTREAINRRNFAPPVALLNPDPYLEDVRGGGLNVSLNGIVNLSNNVFIEATAARIMRFLSSEPATDRGRSDVFFRDDQTGAWSGGVERRFDAFASSTTLSLKGAILLDAHTLKAGVEYKVKRFDYREDLDRVTKSNNTLYSERTERYRGKVGNRMPSVFLQDAWQVVPRLRVYAGVRWDGQHYVGSNGEVVQRVLLPLQPRIGLTYVLDEEGTQRLYGSFGRFSQELNLFLSINNHTNEGYSYTIRYDHDPRISRTGADTTRRNLHTIRPEVPGLRNSFFDEYSLGYEQMVGANIRVNVQGLYRTLREAIDDVWLASANRTQFGNPGRGILAEWPRSRRDYTALVLTMERRDQPDLNFLASYVLSRDYGNYEGLFDAFSHGTIPNRNLFFDDLSSARVNATGLIPNDRTHVFKFSCSYRFSFGLATGISFIAQSGTPLSEYANTDDGIRFLSPRGSVGRTPALWDLSARIVYELPFLSFSRSRMIVDVMHIASQRRPVDIVQLHYFNVNANGVPSNPNPTYGQAYRYQPPMSVRVGMEVNF